MIRRCTEADTPVIIAIVNDAAQAYKGVIPDDCWHEPYMPDAALQAEIDAGVVFWAWEEDGVINGVMGLQVVGDATLIRHAYVRRGCQGVGIGGALLNALIATSTSPMLVGTWADALWAIRFYERHGFTMVSREEKDRLLDRYWTIPSRQRETSVVLRGH